MFGCFALQRPVPWWSLPDAAVWARERLERELQRGLWDLAQGTEADVLEPAGNCWQDLTPTGSMAGRFLTESQERRFKKSWGRDYLLAWVIFTFQEAMAQGF